MVQQSLSNSGTSSHHNVKVSPGYHPLSTFFVITWGLFIAVTVINHELAVYASLKSHPEGVPWVYRPGSGLPSILRTIFSQAHGPITAMHLARLAVNMIDVSWSSPKTWMEAFWLADRRWVGPFGLGRTCWTIISRRLRVSAGFMLLVTLNIVALVTPVVMTRAYPLDTESRLKVTAVNVSAFDLSAAAAENLSDAQVKGGSSLWMLGVPATELFPLNAYNPPKQAAFGGEDLFTLDEYSYNHRSSGVWFFSGDSQQNEIPSLSGVQLEGGCDAWRTYDGPSGFLDRCKKEFGTGLNPHSAVTRQIAYDDLGGVSFSLITNASSCSNVLPTTAFGKDSKSSVLFRLWFEQEGKSDIETILRCNATTGPGTAFVSGYFSDAVHFIYFENYHYAAPNYEPTMVSKSGVLLDPIAAIIQSDLLPFQQSTYLKKAQFELNGTVVTREAAMAAAMWDGVLAMSVQLWLQASRSVEVQGFQWVAVPIIVQKGYISLVLFALLGSWFIGMFAATVAFLRPAWTSALDGYAIARIIQHQPVVAATSEVWFAELEKNEDMLEQFSMHQWRPQEVRSRRYFTRTRSISV